MTSYISQSLADQIVHTVKDLCGQNVNFIDCSGIIFASTDESRVGTFHEIGHQAAADGTIHEVHSDNCFAGTQQGVNLPIYHNHKLIAVIGISGNPNEVRKYAKLAEKITRILIREKELDAFDRNESEKKASILRSLIHREEMHPDYLKENFSCWKLNTDSTWYLVHLQLTADIHTNHALDTAIQQLFQKLQVPLSAFMYPGEYLAVLEEEVFHRNRAMLQKFAQDHSRELCIAIGNPVSIYEIADSALSAEIALKTLLADTNYIEAAELDLELLLHSASAGYKQAFLNKTVAKLSAEDIELLKIYFSSNMSLKAVCEKTFLHKNTIQYRLNQIHKRCGYDPRDFQDAVRLYIALKL